MLHYPSLLYSALTDYVSVFACSYAVTLILHSYRKDKSLSESKALVRVPTTLDETFMVSRSQV